MDGFHFVCDMKKIRWEVLELQRNFKTATKEKEKWDLVRKYVRLLNWLQKAQMIFTVIYADLLIIEERILLKKYAETKVN